MSSRLSQELQEVLVGQRQLAGVPRWTGDQRPRVKSSSFVAPVRMPGGAVMQRPVFFNGYGPFSQVIADMEKWPDYGTNIIQIEVGPRAILPAEDRTDSDPVRALLHTLDRAQRSGVAVCLLISPHYFPDWRWRNGRTCTSAARDSCSIVSMRRKVMTFCGDLLRH